VGQCDLSDLDDAYSIDGDQQEGADGEFLSFLYLIFNIVSL
jgi:hypothetical protein